MGEQRSRNFLRIAELIRDPLVQDPSRRSGQACQTTINSRLAIATIAFCQTILRQ
jgi:hypothetical protein